jgi:glycosyltransferase involved in cell wall biosynthesis
MACNCPVVSVLVGDVPEVIQDVKGCYLASYDEKDIAEKLQKVFAEGQRTEGREVIIERQLDLMQVAERIETVYRLVVNDK